MSTGNGARHNYRESQRADFAFQIHELGGDVHPRLCLVSWVAFCLRFTTISSSTNLSLSLHCAIIWTIARCIFSSKSDSSTIRMWSVDSFANFGLGCPVAYSRVVLLSKGMEFHSLNEEYCCTICSLPHSGVRSRGRTISDPTKSLE